MSQDLENAIFKIECLLEVSKGNKDIFRKGTVMEIVCKTMIETREEDLQIMREELGK